MILLWLLFGRLTIWTIQTNGLTRPIFSLHAKLEELVECDLCLGFWVYAGLAWAMGINLLEPFVDVPGLNSVLSGLAASFAVHLALMGWHDKFSIIHFD